MLFLSSSSSAQTQTPHSGSPYDYFFDQIYIGSEPTRTNPRIIWESMRTSLKTLLTGKGKGVLEIEGHYNQKARERYLKKLIVLCPECKITEVRESHGTLSYRITLPDDFWFNSSLDAGALEWQHQPLSVRNFAHYESTLQKYIFDLSWYSLAWMRFYKLGGHITQSGFGGDTFLISNLLKLNAMIPWMDWGFFGKDGYNAKPARLWPIEQQQKLNQVFIEHDTRWKVFLTGLEQKLNQTTDTDDLITYFETRTLLSEKELVERIYSIYENPDINALNSKIGMTSKEKYVAHKPSYFEGNTEIGQNPLTLIEGRARDPLKNAAQILKYGEYNVAQIIYLKRMMDQGLEVRFLPELYLDPGKLNIAPLAKQTLTELGLRWQDYQDFTLNKNPSPASNHSLLSPLFEESPYGARKRDELYQKTIDRFFSLERWNPREFQFILTLLLEASTTIPKADDFSEKLEKRNLDFQLSPYSFSEENLNKILLLINKFPYHAKSRYQLLERPLLPIFEFYFKNKKIRPLMGWLPYFSRQLCQQWLQAIQLKTAPGMNSDLLDLESQLILKLNPSPETHSSAEIWHWFQSLNEMNSPQLTRIPSQLKEMLTLTPNELLPIASKAFLSLLTKVNALDSVSFTEKNEPSLLSLIQLYPEQSKTLAARYRGNLLEEIEKINYGLMKHTHYRCISLMERILKLTEAPLRLEQLQFFYEKTLLTKKLKNDFESKNLVEWVMNQIDLIKKPNCNFLFHRKVLKN